MNWQTIETPPGLLPPRLLQALIVEAAEIEGQEDPDGYAARVTGLILDQLRRAQPLPGALPWPRTGALVKLCEALYLDPANARGPAEWATNSECQGGPWRAVSRQS